MIGSTVAVTGATGFIGQHLTAALLNTGHTVIALHRRVGTDSLQQDPRLVWTPVADAVTAFRAYKPSAIVHLATCYGVGASMADVVVSNVAMPLRLLETAAANGCALFINTDTFFGKPEFAYPHMRAYLRSKEDFMHWAMLANDHSSGIEVINARLEHVYGPGDGGRKFVPKVLSALMTNDALDLTPGDQLRDFIHVDDVVAAYLVLLQASSEFRRSNFEIGIGNGSAKSVREFVETAKSICGSTSALEFGAKPHRAREIMRSQADTSLLGSLGWRPRHDLSSGIRATVDAIRLERDAVGRTGEAR